MAHVQIDATGAISGEFATPQPSNAGYAEVADDDPRLAAFRAASDAWPTRDAMIGAGVQVTSTSAPTLNGRYAVDGPAQSNMLAVMVGIGAGMGLPGGGATFAYLDAGGAPHEFSAAQFAALAKALRDWVYSVDQAATSRAAGTAVDWPVAILTME